MKRLVAGGLLAAAIGVLVMACDDDDHGYGYRYGGQGGGYDSCAQATSCGTCTPIEGCGWCYDSDGTGVCASSPDECTTQAFSWTWDPSGCRVEAEAGVAAPDSGVSADARSAADAPGDDGAADAPAQDGGDAASQAGN